MTHRQSTSRLARRSLIKQLLIVGGMPILQTAFRSLPALGAVAASRPQASDVERGLMAGAVAMKRLAVAAGDQPYGAVLAIGAKIVGQGPSRVITNRDPTAHAEMEAIRDAARRLGTLDLTGCVMYSTTRPCRMCETAAYWANVSGMRYGADIIEGGPPSYSSC